ncbi:methionine/alanine import family NSS transporter small subunit [Georgenia satyanarayanai]|uniref:methionine/alanine import family NSS transporter small subunit n=1 Tax=Georgenia satyanarayanai TaxID=860221 RepID=UPI0012644188|nr:methionine/alanine import family NSS transporter small subunit [Georgenia satyanarayanai]
MTPLAILFMIIAMLVIWGGLVVAITFLAKHPLEDDDAPTARPGPSRTPQH